MHQVDYKLQYVIPERFFAFIQEDEARPCVAVHGLHVEAVPCDHHAVVRRIKPVQAPSRRGGQVSNVHADRHRTADCTGHGVRRFSLLPYQFILLK